MGLEMTSLRPDDAEAAAALAAQAFGSTQPFDPARPRASEDRVVAVYDGGTLVATATTLAGGQFFGGRSVTMGGLAGVKVDPLHRGRGLARRMLTESFARMRERGEPISTLYPTTAALYRGAGYEIAGLWCWSRVDLRDLPASGDPAVSIEPGSYDDTSVRAAYRVAAGVTNGWLDRADLWWAMAAHDAGAERNRWTYRAVRDGRTVGALTIEHGPAQRRMFGLRATDLHGVDDGVLRALLAFAGQQGTTADGLATLLPIRHLARLVDHAQWIEPERSWPWMTRLVDAPGAIAARGYPADVRAEVALRIVDEVLPGNAGAHVLQVADGAGTLEAGGPGSVETTIQTLAALYTGWADAGELAAAGHLPGADERSVAALRRMFAGAPPTLVDFF